MVSKLWTLTEHYRRLRTRRLQVHKLLHLEIGTHSVLSKLELYAEMKNAKIYHLKMLWASKVYLSWGMWEAFGGHIEPALTPNPFSIVPGRVAEKKPFCSRLVVGTWIAETLVSHQGTYNVYKRPKKKRVLSFYPWYHCKCWFTPIILGMVAWRKLHWGPSTVVICNQCHAGIILPGHTHWTDRVFYVRWPIFSKLLYPKELYTLFHLCRAFL